MKIKTYEDGSARLLWDWRDIALTTANFETLRAFFQAERDEELGRWRDPENPDWVVYRANSGDAAYMFNEREGGASQYWTRGTAESHDPAYTGYSASYYIAGRYFAAHPKPNPWHAARPGEVWALTISREELLCRSNSDGDFTPVFGHHHWVTISNGSREITAGRRIWPEENK